MVFIRFPAGKVKATAEVLAALFAVTALLLVLLGGLVSYWVQQRSTLQAQQAQKYYESLVEEEKRCIEIIFDVITKTLTIKNNCDKEFQIVEVIAETDTGETVVVGLPSDKRSIGPKDEIKLTLSSILPLIREQYNNSINDYNVTSVVTEKAAVLELKKVSETKYVYPGEIVYVVPANYATNITQPQETSQEIVEGENPPKLKPEEVVVGGGEFHNISFGSYYYLSRYLSEPLNYATNLLIALYPATSKTPVTAIGIPYDIFLFAPILFARHYGLLQTVPKLEDMFYLPIMISTLESLRMYSLDKQTPQTPYKPPIETNMHALFLLQSQMVPETPFSTS